MEEELMYPLLPILEPVTAGIMLTVVDGILIEDEELTQLDPPAPIYLVGDALAAEPIFTRDVLYSAPLAQKEAEALGYQFDPVTAETIGTDPLTGQAIYSSQEVSAVWESMWGADPGQWISNTNAWLSMSPLDRMLFTGATENAT